MRKYFVKYEKKVEVVSVHDLSNLAKAVVGEENVDEDNTEWIDYSTNDPGFDHITGNKIVEEVLGMNVKENYEEH